ncbi:MAG: glutathione-regulated potassium-efflux system ancillary protein KefG [Candidatus Latescibacterota bacterium]|jgi:glutathione-regulated potassium-efflux system ancillary protein KefG
MSHKKVLILFAHPAFQKSRANRQLVDAVQNLDGVTFCDLYELYPDFNIHVAKEQQLLLDHDVIVFHHPFYWYSSPALLKEWQDLVLEHGFAYGNEGTALKDKWLLTMITTGGGEEAYRQEGYNHFTIPELLQPFEQTAGLCKMLYLPPFVVHAVNNLSDEEMGHCAKMYQDVIVGLRDGHLTPEQWQGKVYINDTVTEGGSHA